LSASPPSVGRSLRRFLVILTAASPRRAPLAAVVTVLLATTESASVLLLVPMLQMVGVEAGEGSLGRIANIFQAGFHAIGLNPTLPLVLLAFLAFAAVQSGLQRAHSVLSAGVQYDVVSSLRESLYRAIAGAHWVFLARRRASDVMQLLVGEVDRVGTATSYVLDLSASTVIAVAYVTIAAVISPAATACVLAATGLFALLLRARIHRAHHLGREATEARRQLHGAAHDYFAGLKTAKSYDSEDRHVHAFVQLSRRVRDVAVNTIAGYARLRQATTTGTAAVLVLVVYVSIEIVALSSAQLLVLLFVFARLMPRLNALLEGTQVFVSVLPAVDVIDQLHATCDAHRESDATSVRPVTFTREIRLDRVSFSYEIDRSPALRTVNLAIPAGTLTAIVGPSGAGKSTLADVLLGLLAPDEGTVRLDGAPIAPDQWRSWRALVGYVPQDVFLHHASVRDNLLWSHPGASEDDLWRALQAASAMEFVRSLPAGLDTLLGDRGLLVSGGERQRLALARALLRKPRLLILDEPTASVDPQNEGAILEALNRVRGSTTIILITHRLGLTQSADMIHVMEQGRIIESGTWRELQQRDQGRFAALRDARPPSPVPNGALAVNR
jgi:ATP-binding cassette subfamily C protein